MITTICHQFEDLLKYFGDASNTVNTRFIDAALLYVDLIIEASELAKENSSDFSSIQAALNNIRQKYTTDKISCLIVESTKSLTLMYQSILDNYPVTYSVVDDGLAALERLLHESFDFLIIGGEIKSLRGQAVISALRTSDCINHDINIILVTSKPSPNTYQHLEPNYAVKKDIQLSNKLEQAIQNICSSLTNIA